MVKKNLLLGVLFLVILGIFSTCKEEEEDPGPVATCSDGILNQGETQIDCGGPCPACPSITCKVDGADWTSDYTSITAGFFGSVLQIQGGQSLNSSSMLIGYMGLQATGDFPLEAAKYTIGGVNYVMNKYPPGRIIFTDYNTTTKKITGTFEFDAKDTLTGNTVSVTLGVFTNVDYDL